MPKLGIYLVHSPTPKAFANSSPGQRPGLAGSKQSTNSERVRERQFHARDIQSVLFQKASVFILEGNAHEALANSFRVCVFLTDPVPRALPWAKICKRL